MDRETFSQYAWVIILSLIMITIISFASPFGINMGSSIVRMVRGQTDELADAYSDESIKEQQNYMNQLFDATGVLDAGIYKHNDASACMLTWEKLIKNNYILVNDKKVSSDLYTQELTGDLIIGDFITTISNHAFSNTKLHLVRLGASTTSVGISAFANNPNLETFISSSVLKEIKENAFSNCENLKNVYLANTVTKIEANAFYKCDELKTITFYGTLEQWSAIEKGANWNPESLDFVYCNDGKIIST